MLFPNFLALCSRQEDLLNYLIEKKIILGEINCPKCGDVIVLNKNRLEFFCRKTSYVINSSKKRVRVQCSFRQSAKVGTWFEHARIPVDVVCQMTAYFLCMRHPRLQIMTIDLNISRPTAVVWLSLCREVCINWAETNSTPIGGPGLTVEIDEAKFSRRKFNRGRVLDGKWIFGGIERESKKAFLFPVPDRSERTLLSIIREWILPGSTIIAGCWRSYIKLNSGFRHLTVNHRYNFVDPETGAHTQNIERAWRKVRSNIPRYETRGRHLVGYLAEFQFKRAHFRKDLIEAFWNEVANTYPPKIPTPAGEDA